MIKLVLWNIRGLNALSKYKDIMKTIDEYQLSLLCLPENKMRYRNIEKKKMKCIPSWQLIHNCPVNGVGRVWVCWNNDRLEMDLIWSST